MVDVVTRIESSSSVAARESTDGKINTMAHSKETEVEMMPPIKRRSSRPADAHSGDRQIHPRRTSTNRRHHGRLHSLTARNEVEFEAVWGITKEEENALLDQYRKSLERATGKPLHPRFDKHYLQRFLRARQHDLKKAEKMFLDHLAWRKDFGTDTILDDFVYNERDSFLALYPQGYHKVDKSGRPIYVQHLGQINLKALKNVTTEERMIKYHVQEYERALKYIFPACSKVRGHYISQTLAILDLKGVGLRHLNGDVKRILSSITTIDQNNYPETLGKTLIINAPAVFRAIWAIVKPMLDPRTQAKIEVCPADYMKVLIKWIDIENIPSYLGGKSNGSLIDDIGPWNDETIIQEIDKEVAQSLESVAADHHGPSEILPSAHTHDIGRMDELEAEETFQDAVPGRASSVSTLASLYMSVDEEIEMSSTVSGWSGDLGQSRPEVDRLTPVHQVPVIERVNALEDQIPVIEAGMSRALPSTVPKPSSMIGQGTLLARIAALENAVQLLLETQDSLMIAKKTHPNKCCTIM